MKINSIVKILIFRLKDEEFGDNFFKHFRFNLLSITYPFLSFEYK